ncbi:MAG: DMT family transporter [Pseudolabrys sp.]
MDAKAKPARFSSVLIGTLCGVGAASCWAAGFVAAKHGVSIGFTPADLAMHRFFWSGLLLVPVVLRMGVADLGGIGWGRGFVMCMLSGPPQAFLAYVGFTLTPLGHGATIQPACAALFGLLLASVILHERMSAQRIAGAIAIVIGLMAFGFESLTTIGREGVAGDLSFCAAGISWAVFGTLLRMWRVPGTRAVVAVGVLSLVLFAPVYWLLAGDSNIVRLGFAENLLQAVVQGLFAGVLPIYLFARAVIFLGAGRAAIFTALVPAFTPVIGFIALGVVPSVPQLIGLFVVIVGFRFALK